MQRTPSVFKLNKLNVLGVILAFLARTAPNQALFHTTPDLFKHLHTISRLLSYPEPCKGGL
jgi:hypothetical protein